MLTQRELKVISEYATILFSETEALMKFYIVDAFTEDLFGGNPAGVVILPQGGTFPQVKLMKKVAAELRYSETAFVLPDDEDSFYLRYFTPTEEVDLCGHATIASFHALWDAGMIREDTDYRALTMAGEIKVHISDGTVIMSMAEPKRIATISDPLELDRLYDIMGGEYDASLGLAPMIISTGLPDIILPVSNLDELNSLAPDMNKLAELSEHYGVTGVHAFTIDDAANGTNNTSDTNESTTADTSATGGADILIHARNFAPLYGIDEEAATGTANGALTHYLSLNKKIGLPATCKIVQGEAMGRPSIIMTYLKYSSVGAYVLDGPSLESEFPMPPEIFVGGSARILAKGDINI